MAGVLDGLPALLAVGAPSRGELPPSDPAALVGSVPLLGTGEPRGRGAAGGVRRARERGGQMP